MSVVSKLEYWLTADNRLIKIEDVTDDHLRNIIRHVKQRIHLYALYSDRLLEWLDQERMRRGMVDDPSGEPEPWYDSNDNKWKTYSDEARGYVEVIR